MRSPITTERQNIQLLRDSGFTQQQAEAVAAVARKTLDAQPVEPSLAEMIQQDRVAAADARLEQAKAATRRAWLLIFAIVGLANLAAWSVLFLAR